MTQKDTSICFNIPEPEEAKMQRLRESMHPFREGRLIRTAGNWTTGPKLRELADLSRRIVEANP